MAFTRSDENRHDFAFIAGAVIGAIAGALVTLALTPMSGADTREKLAAGLESLAQSRIARWKRLLRSRSGQWKPQLR